MEEDGVIGDSVESYFNHLHGYDFSKDNQTHTGPTTNVSNKLASEKSTSTNKHLKLGISDNSAEHVSVNLILINVIFDSI